MLPMIVIVSKTEFYILKWEVTIRKCGGFGNEDCVD